MENRQNIQANIEYSKLIRQTLTNFCQDLNQDKTTILLPQLKSQEGKCPKGFFSHLCYEIFFQISGSCRFDFVDQKLSLQPGQVLLVPPEVAHKEKAFATSDRPFRNLVMILMENGANIHIAEVSNQDRTLPKPYFMEKLPAESTLYYYHAAEALCQLNSIKVDTHHTACQIIQAMLLKMQVDLGAPTSSNVWEYKLDIPVNDPYKIEVIKKYVADNILNDDLEVRALAKMVNYSPNYLSHLFRKITGESLKEHINRQKMEAARTLLETTPYNISEVAIKCGFQDFSYFSKLYKRFIGIKPQETRKSQLQRFS